MENHWEIVERNKSKVISTTPEGIWEDVRDYFKWCDEHPVKTKKTITSGKGAGNKVEQEFVRPYTIEGMCLHCGMTKDYIKDIRNMQDKTSPYYVVISKAIYIIYCQNVEMSIVGEFNAIFTAKLLNIDKEDTSGGAIKVMIETNTPTLSNSENDILEKLESEIALYETVKDKNT